VLCGPLRFWEGLVALAASYQSPGAIAAPEALLCRSTVLQLLGIGATRLHALVRTGELPAPVRLGASARWPASEIRAVLAAVKAGRSGGAAMRDLARGLMDLRNSSSTNRG
jgi:predicted DNA-binding transcriptional regulator AlpA